MNTESGTHPLLPHRLLNLTDAWRRSTIRSTPTVAAEGEQRPLQLSGSYIAKHHQLHNLWRGV